MVVVDAVLVVDEFDRLDELFVVELVPLVAVPDVLGDWLRLLALVVVDSVPVLGELFVVELVPLVAAPDVLAD